MIPNWKRFFMKTFFVWFFLVAGFISLVSFFASLIRASANETDLALALANFAMSTAISAESSERN